MRIAIVLALAAVLVGVWLFYPAPAARAAEPPGSVAALFPVGLVDAQGQAVSVDALKEKIVGVYFSAHWCPPCRQFSPLLVKFRDKHSGGFEVVFVSLDHSEKEQQAYMRELEMKWPTVKYGSKAGEALAQRFGVESIPTLVILASDGKEITRDGRADVLDHAETALERWQAESKTAAK
jgi:nucleoredoxin